MGSELQERMEELKVAERLFLRPERCQALARRIRHHMESAPVVPASTLSFTDPPPSPARSCCAALS